MKIRHFLFLWILYPIALTAQPFSFTAIPDEDTHRLQERFGKVAQYLTEELGIPVMYVPVKSYSASVTAFKNNEVQLAWFGGLSGVRARRAVPGATAIAQGEEDVNFISYFIANTKTGLQGSKDFPAEIRGKTFTFGSKGSTSGRLMPEYYIRQHYQQEPQKVFRRVGFSGDHSKTIALVQSGSYEVGALNYKVWDNELKAGKIDTNKVKIIWRSPTYPDYNWSIRPGLDMKFGQGFSEKVKMALINLADRSLLDTFPRKRFIAADNAMYEPILKTAIAIGLIDN